MVVELGLITPPIGMNVFVIKGIAREVPLERIFRGAMPFVGAQIIAYANPLRRARKAQEFDPVFEKMLSKLHELEEKPEKVLGARG